MSRFPEPVNLPENVFRQRAERERDIVHSAFKGIAIRLTIILFECVGVYLYSSSALLLDVVASFIDVFSSISLIVCIKFAAKPPDANHPFGHGRFEPLLGLILGLMLVAIGGGLLLQQWTQLTSEHIKGVIDQKAWIFPAVALVLLEISYRIVIRTAKKENSPALEADAIHYRIDGLTSLFALIALILAAYYPAWSLYFDHAGALSIAILMIGFGIYSGSHNFNQLVDRVPDQQFFDRVREAALGVAGVCDTEKIRIQLYGPDAHVDIDIEVEPQLSVELAHQISQQVRAEIQKAWPAVRDVTVHIEPYYPNDH